MSYTPFEKYNLNLKKHKKTIFQNVDKTKLIYNLFNL